ncbi:glycoside hydrolase family 19 protein [Vineibacter terrae]|uniref:glycoside hydrolase family 19 protein n=1 Tax=Vineibacter terrae TaxID=2586908 RepID=UPI002E380E66|nr:glycoside hydrolase family 19 protein [Vineibacter terrae]HEX2888091.1 glycoside hydrolase family 19 protein [Vineibacter terrae]
MPTKDQLAAIMPLAAKAGRLDVWYKPLTKEMAGHAITTPAREAMFLANVAEETGELAAREENLSYSGARLRQVFPSMFEGRGNLAEDLAAQGPQAIANYIYADRNRPVGYKLGNINPDDGWRYRGRGPMQLTGRANYERFFLAIGMPADSDPDLVLGPDVGARSACHFWQAAGCNEIADSGDFAAVVKRVNGGHINLALRLKYLERAKAALAAPVPDVADPPPGTERKPDGNVMIRDIKESTIIQDSNKGLSVTTVTAVMGASAPVITATAGMDWRLAAVLGAVVLIAGGAIAFYQLRIKRARLAMFRDGVA